MKKKLLVGIMLVLVLALSGCGGTEREDKENTTKTESSTDGEKKDSDKENKKDSKKKEVSLEALESLDVSPAEDFEVMVDGINPDGWSLCGYNGKDEMVAIPDEIDGKKVVSLIGNTFGKESGVKAVKIPDSVERISGGFRENEELQYVIFGSGVKEIGENSFFGCKSLTSVELNEGIEVLKANAFASVPNLKYLYVPDSVTEIIGTAIYVTNKEFLLAGKAGSKAEELAKTWNYTFEAVE